MHGRAPTPKQAQIVKKEEPRCDCEKFTRLAKKFPLVSETNPLWVDTIRAKSPQITPVQNWVYKSKIQKQNKASYQSKPLSTKTVTFEHRRQWVSNPYFASKSCELDLA